MNNTKVVIGHFPKQICYVSGIEHEVSVGCEWDMDYSPNSTTPTEKVVPAFPADNDDPKSLQTAISWGKSIISRDNYSKLLGKRVKNEDLPEPQTEVVENKFITGIRLLSLESRGNGGRAYKALIGKHYVDVREDVVMDTMLKEGIAPGGLLNGEFIWAKVGSQMKLVRKDSELYNLVIEFESKRNIKPVSKKNLEVGGVYRTKKKEAYIYLGNINTVAVDVPKTDRDDKIYFQFTKREIKNMMLFYKIYKHQTIEESLKEMFKSDSYYRFDLKKTHSFIEMTEKLNLDLDIVEQISKNVANGIKKNILDYVKDIDNKSNYNRMTASKLATYISYASRYLNMYLVKETPKETFDVQKYLLFS